jgi:hypothetical protein
VAAQQRRLSSALLGRSFCFLFPRAGIVDGLTLVVFDDFHLRHTLPSRQYQHRVLLLKDWYYHRGYHYYCCFHDALVSLDAAGTDRSHHSYYDCRRGISSHQLVVG